MLREDVPVRDETTDTHMLRSVGVPPEVRVQREADLRRQFLVLRQEQLLREAGLLPEIVLRDDSETVPIAAGRHAVVHGPGGDGHDSIGPSLRGHVLPKSDDAGWPECGRDLCNL
jgi:hypothetical protein